MSDVGDAVVSYAHPWADVRRPANGSRTADRLTLCCIGEAEFKPHFNVSQNSSLCYEGRIGTANNANNANASCRDALSGSPHASFALFALFAVPFSSLPSGQASLNTIVH
jgi:hypothetical protein